MGITGNGSNVCHQVPPGRRFGEQAKPDDRRHRIAYRGHGSLRPFAEHARGRREEARVELKRSLRGSEEALQGLIEASLQGVLIVTKEYEPLLANQTCARIFDFESPAEIKALDSIVDLIASPALTRFGAIGIDITERRRAGSRRTISLYQDGGKRAR